jgi:hypothetical protein
MSRLIFFTKKIARDEIIATNIVGLKLAFLTLINVISRYLTLTGFNVKFCVKNR